MPLVGLEPTRHKHQFLKLARLPFRHKGLVLLYNIFKKMLDAKIPRWSSSWSETAWNECFGIFSKEKMRSSWRMTFTFCVKKCQIWFFFKDFFQLILRAKNAFWSKVAWNRSFGIFSHLFERKKDAKKRCEKCHSCFLHPMDERRSFVPLTKRTFRLFFRKRRKLNETYLSTKFDEKNKKL